MEAKQAQQISKSIALVVELFNHAKFELSGPQMVQMVQAMETLVKLKASFDVAIKEEKIEQKIEQPKEIKKKKK